MLKFDVKFGQIDLTEYKFVLFLKGNLIVLLADSKVELTIGKPEKFLQKGPTSKNLVFLQFIDKLFYTQLLNWIIDEGNCKIDTDKQDLFVVKAVFGNIAVKVENSSLKFLLFNVFSGCFYGCWYLVDILAKSLLKFSITGEDEFLVEVIAVYVDGLMGVDGAGHEDDAVFESHREGDIVVVIDVEYTFEEGVVGGVEIWVGVDVRSYILLKVFFSFPKRMECLLQSSPSMSGYTSERSFTMGTLLFIIKMEECEDSILFSSHYKNNKRTYCHLFNK